MMDGPSSSELRAFYERYIEAFNTRDRDGFVDCFDLPVTVMRLGADGAPVATTTVTEPDDLWPALPATWTHSTIDEVRPIGGDTFSPRPGFVAVPRRAALEVTVTRWAGEVAYEQFHVLYLLTIEGGRPRIASMMPLAAAYPAS